MDPRIEEYIRANRRKYTREAIRQQLIEAGHDPADIDATWAMLDAPDPDDAGVAGGGFWVRFFLFLIGLNLAVFLLVTLTTGMLAAIGAGSGFLLVVFAVVLAIGALIAWGIVAIVGPDKMSRGTAMVVGAVIPLIFAFLIGGSCYAMFAGMGPPPVQGVMDVRFGDPLNLEASGPTSCQRFPGGQGFNVFSQSLGIVDGRDLSASVGSFRMPTEGPTPVPGPGGVPGEELTVSVVLQSNDGAGPLMEWYVGQATRIELDAAPDGLSGTARFTGLEPIEVGPVDPGETPEGALDGEISWTCE